ncbi:MAG: carotenoid biosynthesis protein [Candidatus Nanopelagicales bacterium]
MRLSAAFAALTVLSQILWVLVSGPHRDLLTAAGVVLFFLASLTHALATQPPAWTAKVFGLLLGFGWLVEAVGTTWHVPFGDYTYGGQLGPMLGPVPALIPLAWAMMGYPCYVVAARVKASRPGRVALAAALLATWDLFLDPQMVAEAHWTFAHPDPGIPGVPGIPLTNFAGWAVAATVLMIGIDRLAGPPPQPVLIRSAPVALLAWVYLSNVLANAVFFGRPIVAIIGAVGMGIPIAIVARSLVADARAGVA